MKTILPLLLLLTSGLCAQRPELALSQEEFDSFDCCWRKLNAEKRYAEGAALLADYIKKALMPNAKTRSPGTRHSFMPVPETITKLYNTSGRRIMYFTNGLATGSGTISLKRMQLS